ncbi:cytochrome c [bacterium]|nr:cytochrome c [bacterium]
MRRTARVVAFLATGMLATWSAEVRADDITNKLPPGPIRERHELMEEIGDQAENINNAFNVGSEGFDTSIIQRAGTTIAMDAHRIPDLFPKGSTDPNSRALPKIWENWDEFVKLAKQLEDQAQKVSAAAGAEDDEDLKGKVKKMFATCKSCHDQFRKPKDEKKK